MQRGAAHAGLRAVARDADLGPRADAGEDVAARPRGGRARAGARRPRDTPPPMTTRSGSKVLTTLAMPMPSRSPWIAQRLERRSSPLPGRRRRRRGRRSKPRSRAELVQGAARGQDARASRAAARAAAARGAPSREVGADDACARARARRRSRRGRCAPSMTIPPPTPVPTVIITSDCRRAGCRSSLVGLGQRGDARHRCRRRPASPGARSGAGAAARPRAGCSPSGGRCPMANSMTEGTPRPTASAGPARADRADELLDERPARRRVGAVELGGRERPALERGHGDLRPADVHPDDASRVAHRRPP